tara:strand:- start:754 stop:1953 length:1200 start_codon:yes stop_codon:yes gene_type:complete
MGMVSPIGLTAEASWVGAVEGRTGVRRISLFDPSACPVQLAAEVPGFDPAQFFDAKEVRRTSRVVQFSVAAAEEAVSQSGLDTSHNSERFGCSIGVGMGALADIEQNALLLENKGYKRISPFFIPYTIANMPSGIVSIRYGLKGPNICPTTACASGTHGIGEGFEKIRMNMADVMVCGGAEATICPLGIGAFNALKALSKNNQSPEVASRPFDKGRDGFVMGEGAGILILEELEHARQRGADIFAEVVGYGLTGDAHHITAPAPGHEGGARCMKMAIDLAGLHATDVDYINAHGTSTQMNDKYEAEAIHQVFGSNVAVSSTKGSTGHCIGGAGGIEGIFAVKSVFHGVVPPTANLVEPDDLAEIDLVAGNPREMAVGVALSNSFGFGGTNATVVFKRFA